MNAPGARPSQVASGREPLGWPMASRPKEPIQQVKGPRLEVNRKVAIFQELAAHLKTRGGRPTIHKWVRSAYERSVGSDDSAARRNLKIVPRSCRRFLHSRAEP